MAKVFQIMNNMCYWCTPYSSVEETVGRYPEDVKFVEAPDYVNEQWGFIDEDENGNPIEGDARFIQPTAPEGWYYDMELGAFINEEDIPEMLESAKNAKQEENKSLFARFLAEHPLTWTDGKVYGVTLEDQSEISLNLTQYNLQVQNGIENPVLEWHASKEACAPWTYEDLSALALTISQYIYPWFQKMNQYKEQIFSCTDRKEVEAIVLEYKTEEEIAAAAAAAEEEAARIAAEEAERAAMEAAEVEEAVEEDATGEN